MPDVVEMQLDVALSDIERAGFEDEVEILGGGTFGVVDESNWTVCEQLPAAGEPLTGTPRVTVDRSCGGEEAAESTTTVAESTTSTAPPTTVAPIPEETLTVGQQPRAGSDPGRGRLLQRADPGVRSVPRRQDDRIRREHRRYGPARQLRQSTRHLGLLRRFRSELRTGSRFQFRNVGIDRPRSDWTKRA